MLFAVAAAGEESVRLTSVSVYERTTVPNALSCTIRQLKLQLNAEPRNTKPVYTDAETAMCSSQACNDRLLQEIM